MTQHGASGSRDPDDPGLSGETPEEVDPADILGSTAGQPLPSPDLPRARWRRGLKLAAAAAALALVVAGIYAYRSHQQRRIVDLSISRARSLIRADTWLGHQRAAEL